jgi:hypothetical protein
MRTYLALFFIIPILAVLGAAMPLDPELSAAAGLLLSSVLVSPFLMRVSAESENPLQNGFLG